MKGHGVVYVVVCAAPPAQHIHELVSLLRSDHRQVIVFATPTAAEWINRSLVRDLTGAPVRSVARSVDEPRTQPAPDAVVVAPATFNTINKWAAGINDNAAAISASARSWAALISSMLPTASAPPISCLGPNVTEWHL